MHKRYGLAVYRLVLGLAAFAAVIAQLVYGLMHNDLKLVNFFSYFTIQSNILAASIFILMGKAALLGITIKQRALVRGAAVLYMTITGIVYALLLSGVDVRLGITMPWVNTVLHYIMPVAVLLDWFIDPPAKRISFRAALVWLAFPLVFVAYSLIRGAATGWYPYPFLNPDSHGYTGVVLISVVLLAAAVVLVWLISRVSGQLKGRKAGARQN